MRARPRRFRRISRTAFAMSSARTRPLRVPRAPAARWRCPRSSPLANPLDVRASANDANHSRDQEQQHSDEEDRLGDFDGCSGDAAKAQYAGDERNDQKRYDPAQHDSLLSVLSFLFGVGAPRLKEQSGPEMEVPGATCPKIC